MSNLAQVVAIIYGFALLLILGPAIEALLLWLTYRDEGRE